MHFYVDPLNVNIALVWRSRPSYRPDVLQYGSKVKSAVYLVSFWRFPAFRGLSTLFSVAISAFSFTDPAITS